MSDPGAAPFTHGVVFAAGVCASTFGNDTIARELLEEVGITSVRQLRAMDIPTCDIDSIRHLLPELRRRAMR